MTQRIPADVFPPGEFIQDELDARGWTQSDFSQIIGRDPKSVNMILTGKTRITEETAQLLEAALGIEAQYWLNLEYMYRLALARENAVPDRVARKAKLYGKFPISLMIKQRWIKYSESIEVLEQRVKSFFAINSLDEEPRLCHAWKRKDAPQKDGIQLAWLYRTHAIAKAMATHGFTQKKLNAAFEKLRLLLKNAEDIRHIPRILEEAGIRFVIVEAIPGSLIDGACYWLDANSPVVCMSLRFERIDNFWFVLLHELRHIANGHGKDNGILDINLFDRNAEISEQEKQVNTEAANFLVDTDQLSDFVTRVRPIFSALNIAGFAERMMVHPGIVVGQLHHKHGDVVDYTKHNKMIAKVKHIICATALCDGWGTSLLQTED